VFTLYSVLQNIRYGTIKIIFDTVLVTLAVIASLTMLDGPYGVREGTIFSALAVGLVIRIISRVHITFRRHKYGQLTCRQPLRAYDRSRLTKNLQIKRETHPNIHVL